MHIEIITRTRINTETGSIQSTSTWRIDGEDKGLGPAIHSAAARLVEQAQAMTPAATDDPPPPGERPIGSPPARAHHLAGLVRVPTEDLAEAIKTRPMGRIVEVLQWMKDKQKKQKVQSPTALFWTLVNRD